MLRIRLSRVGRKHDPSYRIVVIEKGQPPQSGSYVEQVGTYNPKNDKHQLKAERITYWISCGAQPSDTVHNLLVKTGILDENTINPLPQKSSVKKEEPKTKEEITDQEEENIEDDKPGNNDEEIKDDEPTTKENPATEPQADDEASAANENKGDKQEEESAEDGGDHEIKDN